LLNSQLPILDIATEIVASGTLASEKYGAGKTVIDNAIFKDYLAQIEQACKAGNATEHTIELQSAIDEALGEWPL
jgi:hypothetical protein